MDIDEVIENFQFLDDWEDRYKYLIELGAMLAPLPQEAQTRENKVKGCVSQVWLISSKSEHRDPILTFTGESDAHIVRGLIAIAFALFSNRPASEILACDEIRNPGVRRKAGVRQDRLVRTHHPTTLKWLAILNRADQV